MTPEIILIIILVFALATVGLGWANAEAHRQALDAVCSTLAMEKGELQFELDRAKAAIKATPVGPRFAWDPKDNCWVLKDCVRADHGLLRYNVPPYYAYANIDLKWKNADESKPKKEKAAKDEP